jgi:dolichyldiphosphatase
MVNSSKAPPTVLDTIQRTIGASAKHCVIATVCLVVLKIDSILPTYYVVVAMGNAVLSKVLKKIIREPRPTSSPKKGHGMPSSHAQSIYYFAALLCFKIIVLLTGEPPISGRVFVLGLAGLLGIVFYSYYAW